MNISKIAMWSAGVALALTTTVLAAQGFGPKVGGKMGGSGSPANCGPMARLLNLTEAQQATRQPWMPRPRWPTRRGTKCARPCTTRP
jgi:Spy/CpxP family protein refolding chaperone